MFGRSGENSKKNEVGGNGRAVDHDAGGLSRVSSESASAGSNYNTVLRAINQLEQLKILTLANKAKRGRVYCAHAVLKILKEPARLTPA